jgi:peptidoglycan LD-endopeptidase CwlK
MNDVVIDSALHLDEALLGLVFPDDVRNTLELVDVRHHSFDAAVHQGQLVVHTSLAQEVREIFEALFALRFPIAKVIPIVAYNWSDDASMADNNSSAFNYRKIYGTDDVSNHSLGRAVDINPLLNPYIARDGSVHPSAGVHQPGTPGTFAEDDPATQVFLSRGWEWGGHWPDRKDWQHFQKLS